MRHGITSGLFSASLCLGLTVQAVGLHAAAAQAARAIPAAQNTTPASGTSPAPTTATQGEHIVAVVNGDVISQGDVDARGRLFALSTGMGVSPDILARLRPQVTRQLIDERLRLQEEQKRKIVVSDKEIADAVAGIEQRNGMTVGALRAKLSAEGVALRTLYDQTRVQLGWTRVLRDELGPRADITDAEITAELARLKAQTGQTEYQIAEIFLPIDDPSKAAETQRFADTVIGQLRAGAPFSVVAAQFSQSQTALQGGDAGWVHLDQEDPQVAAVLKEMPQGAISNPIRVPGGISIVTLRGKREVGHDMATMISLRQVFLPFSTPLDPANPTEQQKKQLVAAEGVVKTAHSCDAMEADAKSLNSPRPANPGDVRLESLNPQMRGLLGALAPEQVSKPLVSSEGIGLIMVCSRDQKNVADVGNKEEVGQRLLNDRVELVSRQLVRELRRKAIIDVRG